MAADHSSMVAGPWLTFTHFGNIRCDSSWNGFQERPYVVATTAAAERHSDYQPRRETAIDYVLISSRKARRRSSGRRTFTWGIHRTRATSSSGCARLSWNRNRIRPTPSCTEDDPSNQRARRVTGTLTTAEHGSSRSGQLRTASRRLRPKNSRADLVDRGGEDQHERPQLQVPACVKIRSQLRQ